MSKSSSSGRLEGRRIVITRPREQSAELRSKLEALGAEVSEMPLIQVTKHYDKSTLVEIFAEIGQYEWIVFTSANGARFFFEEFHRAFEDIRAMGLMRIAAVGEATADVVRSQHLRVDLKPTKANAEELAKIMIERESIDSAKILVVTGNLNRDTLVDRLHEAQAIVDRLPIYKTEETDLASDPVAGEFRNHGADAILFASPSAAQSFFDQAAALKLGPKAKRPLAGSIGATTTATMKQLGLPVDFEASEASIDSLIEAMIAKLK
jgi:uroporphyrinogen-III synthase